MATINKVLRDSIISSFISDNMYGDRGSFKSYKMLQDLIIDYLARGALEGITQDAREEFFHRFKLISDTIFDLETLATEQTIINNIKASNGQPTG